MNKNIIKTVIFSFLLLFSIAFINIDGVKAEDVCDGTNPNDVCSGNGKGYAKCYYEWYENSIETGAGDNADFSGQFYSYGSHFRPYKFGVAAYKGNDGYFYAWGDLGCGEGNNPWTKKTTGTCPIENYNYNFNQFVTVGLCDFVTNCNAAKSKRKEPKWKCPNKIYVVGKFPTENKQIYFDLEHCKQYHSENDCIAKSLSKNSSSQNGQPGHLSVHDYEINESDTDFQSVNDKVREENEENWDEWKQKIINWANTNETSNLSDADSDCNLIPSIIIKYLKNLFFIIQIIGVLMLVFLSALEFVKAITGSNEDGIKEAIKNTFKRIIAVVLLLILPAIIIWSLNMANDNRYKKDENGQVIIGDDGNPLCNITDNN